MQMSGQPHVPTALAPGKQYLAWIQQCGKEGYLPQCKKLLSYDKEITYKIINSKIVPFFFFLLKLTTHLYLVPRSRMSGAISPLPHTSSRRGA
jgi:hypothetical protein